MKQAIRSHSWIGGSNCLKAAYYEVLRDSAKVQNYYADDVLKNVGRRSKDRLFNHGQHISGAHTRTFRCDHFAQHTFFPVT